MSTAAVVSLSLSSSTMEPPPPRSPTKPPLITPSASPPPTRFTSQPYRRSDSAPPLKRQRTASTPRRTFQDSASSSNSRTQTPVVDPQKEREASRARLLDVWSSLAERYSRPIEDDDLVDFATLDLIHDNGVMWNTPVIGFGALSAVVDETTDAEEEEEEDEYDLDELDAFAEPDQYEQVSDDNSEPALETLAMPPANLFERADADDLQEFMAAEERRREVDGDDDFLTDSDASEERHDECRSTLNELELSRVEDDLQYDDAQVSDSEEEVQVDQGEETQQEDEPGGYTEGFSDFLVPLDISEDELDNWDVDDSNACQIVGKEESQQDPTDDNDSDIEILDRPALSKSRLRDDSTKPTASPVNSRRPPSTSPRKALQQLQTPPRSQSSAGPSSSPIEGFLDILAEPNDPFSSDATLEKSSPAFDHSPKNTPKELKPTLINKKANKTPLPKLDFTKVPADSSSKRGRMGPPMSTKKQPTPLPSPTKKAKPFVLLTPRKGSTPIKISSEPDDIDDEKSQKSSRPSVLSSLSKKGKGKERDVGPYSEEAPSKEKLSIKRQEKSPSPSESNEDLIMYSSPSKHTRSRDRKSIVGEAGPSKVLKPRLDGRVELDLGHMPTNGSVTRKRKRVLSGGIEEGMDYIDVEKTVTKPGKPNRQMSTAGNPSTSYGPSYAIEDIPELARGPSPFRKRYPRESDHSDSASDSSSSELNERRRRKRSQSRSNTLPPASHYLYPHGHYMPMPPQQGNAGPPPGFAIPDPRAQFIIAQAMQQLSSLVGASWHAPPPPHYIDGSVGPHTPSRRSQSIQPSGMPYTTTPVHHPHPYPYAYDPSFSHATLPPDSPDYRSSSSPEKASGSGIRRTLVRRSRSRGRRVSFHVDDDSDDLGGFDAVIERSSSPEVELDSSPSRRKSKPRKPGALAVDQFRPLAGKGKAKVANRHVEVLGSGEESGQEEGRRKLYVRGQTPGPVADSPRRR